ncbi:MAG: glycosyltransferase [Selenomonadaceae bacterium]|nr:glycosyltransferase [Selenomonadaceae bacterium]MDY2685103.1 glycosyltransferase [Selenomonadaceae bacterium]
MSKARRMLKKKQQKKDRQEVRQNLGKAESEFEALFAEEKYEEALQALAKLIDAGDRNPALFYQAAYSYYMLGDNDRAAEWINNTLAFAPAHVQARVLLARICFAENRAADGFKIFEFLLSREKAALNEEDFAAIRQSMAYALRHDRGAVCGYPHLAAFLGLKEKQRESKSAAADRQASGKDSASDTIEKLQALKEKLQRANESNVAPAREKTAATTEAKPFAAAPADDMPTVSVIVPVYHAVKYLRACLDSIAAQTLTDYEVILIDDAGEDGSLAIEEAYAKRPNWRLYCLAENAGPGLARNTGLRRANGKYIAFVDSDDVLAPAYLEHLVEAAERQRADLVVGGYVEWEEDEAGKILAPRRETAVCQEETLVPSGARERADMLLSGKGLPVPNPVNRLYRRAFLQSRHIEFPSMRRFEDTVFNLAAYLEAGTFVLIPYAEYQRRRQPDSITHQSEEQHAAYLRSILQAFDWLEAYAAVHPFVAEDDALKTALGVYIMNHMTIGLLCQYPLEQATPIVDRFVKENFREHAAFVRLLLLRYLSELQA